MTERMTEQNVDQLRYEIQMRRHELTETVHELEHRVEDITDWRYLVRQFPWVSVGACVGMGFLLSRSSVPLLRVTADQGGLVARSLALKFLMGLVKTS